VAFEVVLFEIGMATTGQIVETVEVGTEGGGERFLRGQRSADAAAPEARRRQTATPLGHWRRWAWCE